MHENRGTSKYMISEKGSLKDTPVIKLLLTVFEQTLTGILYIKKDDVLKVLYFNRGKIIWAISNSDEDKLENILAAKDVVDPVTIRKVKSESRVSESIGKLLVEKGLITLEELIDCSKDQLRHIIVSTLKWQTGGFQFVKDAPPERLLSLDLSVTEFIIQYILDEVDISDIWKEIGSLQLELIKNPDEEKIARYNLSDKQSELLNSFDGERRLESILSRYSGGHRESLLKIIYFFLISDLLIKKAFDLSDASVFDTGDAGNSGDTLDSGDTPGGGASAGLAASSGTSLDPDSPFETYNTGEIARSNAEPPPIVNKEKDFQPFDSDLEHVSSQFGGGSLEEEFRMERSDLPDLPEENISTTSFSAANQPEEKKRINPFNFALIMVFFILVFGGIILLLLPWLEGDETAEKNAKKVNSADIITLEETPKTPKIIYPNGTEAYVSDLKKEPPREKPGQTPETKPKKKPEKKPDTKTDKKADNKKDKKKNKKPATTKTAKKDDKKEMPFQTVPGKSPLAYFKEGSFITAADVWKRELINAGFKHSIMLELDCQKQSVYHAYNRMKKHKDFFILNRRVGKRNCYLVLWGKFFTESEASRVLKRVPNYFWKQKDPPEIIELKKYF